MMAHLEVGLLGMVIKLLPLDRVRQHIYQTYCSSSELIIRC